MGRKQQTKIPRTHGVLFTKLLPEKQGRIEQKTNRIQSQEERTSLQNFSGGFATFEVSSEGGFVPPCQNRSSPTPQVPTQDLIVEISK